MDKCRIVMVYRNAAFCLISQSIFKTYDWTASMIMWVYNMAYYAKKL